MSELRTITPAELATILEKHAKWLRGEEGGERANLTYANLTYTNLTYANLTYANLTSADLRYTNLTYANLTYANLTSADLTSADLTSANLAYANLRYARLDTVKQDLIVAILHLPDEIPFLRQALVDGKIDGSTYTGNCACLAGTMCNAKGMDFTSFQTQQLMPVDAYSPREKWFLNLRPGHTPENSAVAKVTLGWIDEALLLVTKIRGQVGPCTNSDVSTAVDNTPDTPSTTESEPCP